MCICCCIRVTECFLVLAKGGVPPNFPKACLGLYYPHTRFNVGCQGFQKTLLGAADNNTLHCSENQIRKVIFLPGQNKLLAVKN